MENFVAKNSKYNAKLVIVDGITFDSQMEADFYLDLKNCAADDVEIVMQPTYELLPKFHYLGENVRPLKYIADFRIGKNVIDVKGMETSDFKIKAKVFKFQNPTLKLMLVTKCPKVYKSKSNFFVPGWITLEQLKLLRKENKKNKLKEEEKCKFQTKMMIAD
jgi:hypothetical protein